MAERKKRTTKKKTEIAEIQEVSDISSSKELKDFLLTIRDRLAEGQAAMINAVSVMNYILNLPEIYKLLDKDSKEVARDIWLRIKQAGVQLKNPPLLFDADEEVFDGAS